MNHPVRILQSVWRFYAEGFKNMTWGRTLWLIVLIKLFIMFAILRVFFFKPFLRGLDDEQKSEVVGSALSNSL